MVPSNAYLVSLCRCRVKRIAAAVCACAIAASVGGVAMSLSRPPSVPAAIPEFFQKIPFLAQIPDAFEGWLTALGVKGGLTSPDALRLYGMMLVAAAFAAGAVLELADCVRSCRRRKQTSSHVRALQVVAQRETAIVSSVSEDLRKETRSAEVVSCRTLPELVSTLRATLPRWLMVGGAPAPVAQSASDAGLFFLDLVTRTPQHTEHGVCIAVCPYEVLPSLLASPALLRDSLAEQAGPPPSVRQHGDWPRLKSSIERFCFDGTGGLLLRPTGAVDAVLKKPPVRDVESCVSGNWADLARAHSGLVVLTVGGIGAGDGSSMSLMVYHGNRALRFGIAGFAVAAAAPVHQVRRQVSSPAVVQMGMSTPGMQHRETPRAAVSTMADSPALAAAAAAGSRAAAAVMAQTDGRRDSARDNRSQDRRGELRFSAPPPPGIHAARDVDQMQRKQQPRRQTSSDKAGYPRTSRMPTQ